MIPARWAVAAVVLLAFGGIVLGNGIKMPQIGFPKMPEIPSQRAFITYQDGLQTLIVESSYITESPEVGWVLPVPAEPQAIEVADRDLLASVSMCMRPNMVHDLRRELETTWIAFFIVCACSIAAIAGRKGSGFGIKLGLVLVFSALLVSVMLPALNSAKGGGGGPSPGIDELSVQRVGSYEVTALKAQDASALQAWLKEKGLAPVPAAGVPLVEDYAKQGWVVLGAKLANDGKGASAAHPLVVKFPTRQPVFPMRLTALAGTTTHVDLYIAADAAARAEGFTVKSVDRYNEVPSTKDLGQYYRAQDIWLIIGSPDAAAHLWHGCVVTHLSASLTPARMNRDVWIAMEPFTRPHRERVYSAQGRRQATHVTLILGAMTVVGVLGIACRYRQWPKKPAICTTAVLLVATIATVVYVRLMYPVADVIATSDDVDEEIVWSRVSLALRQRHLGHLATDADNVQQVRAILSPTTLPASPQERRWLLNPLTGKPIREERTPGNYILREENGVTTLCLYDVDGREHRFNLRQR